MTMYGKCMDVTLAKISTLGVLVVTALMFAVMFLFERLPIRFV